MAAKKHILAVDDETDILLILRTALSDTYRVSTATSGMDCLSAVESERPHLIILDLMMPGMDGLETLRRLKANDATCDIPVVFLTGVSDKEKIREALQGGTSYYLTKPFELNDLMNKVEMALSETTFP